jgi:hypothetical protein
MFPGNSHLYDVYSMENHVKERIMSRYK